MSLFVAAGAGIWKFRVKAFLIESLAKGRRPKAERLTKAH
jgi:hypothetical protein